PSGSASCPSWRSSGRPSAPVGTTPTGARRSTASSSGCVRAARGSSCPASSAPRAPSTTGSSAGAKARSCNASGRNWSKSATNWGPWTGNGRPLPDGWAKPASGGKKGENHPTDAGRTGTQPSVRVAGAGGPLGAGIAAANVNDQKLVRATIEAIVVDRPRPTKAKPQHLCLDAASDNPEGREAATQAKYTPHIRCVKEAKQKGDRSPGHKPRRWVVERTLAWLCKCRGILVRYDKKDENYLGLIQLACALFWYRRLYRLGRCDAKQGPQNTS